MSAKHTALGCSIGPWTVTQRDAESCAVRDANEEIVVGVHGQYVADDHGNTPLQPHEKANARLIAAALDLYEACQAAIDMLTMGYADNRNKVLERLRAASAKAEGHE